MSGARWNEGRDATSAENKSIMGGWSCHKVALKERTLGEGR